MLINYQYKYLFASFFTKVFSVLVIWIERDEHVDCRCTFEEMGMAEVYYKVKPWNGDLSSQYPAITYYQTLLFFSDIQYKSVFGVFFVFLCKYKHYGVYYITGASR